MGMGAARGVEAVEVGRAEGVWVGVGGRWPREGGLGMGWRLEGRVPVALPSTEVT